MDLILLEKILRQGQMTGKEIGQMFRTSPGHIAKFRRRFRIERPMKYKCNVCGGWYAANCFKSDYSGLCIICRVKRGIEKPHQKAGPGRGHIASVKRVKAKCLKCNRPFEARTGYAGKRIDYLCDRCKFINSFIGPEEDGLQILYG